MSELDNSKNGTKTMKFMCENFVIEKNIKDGLEKCYVLAPDAAGIIALSDDDRIILTRELRQGKMSWYIPAGRKKPSDFLIADCAHRELREETGFDATELNFFFSTESKAAWYKQKKSFFIARGLFDAPLDTGDEEIKPEVHYKTPKEVLRILNNGEIDDDIAAALYRFLHVHILTQNIDDMFARIAAAKENAPVPGVH